MSEMKVVKKQTLSKKKPLRIYNRFHWTRRIEHALLLTTFTMLGITGLPQKFSTAGWAQALIGFFGGIETTRLIHHIFAIVIMLLAVYHIVDIGYQIFVKRTRLSMQLGLYQKTTADGTLYLRRKGGVLGLNLGNRDHGHYRFHDVESHHHRQVIARGNYSGFKGRPWRGSPSGCHGDRSLAYVRCSPEAVQ
jgi:hypothetical protein